MQGFHPQKHKAAQVKNYANGGIVKGPGNGQSDDVPAMVPRDGYVLPADSTKALGFRPGMRPAEAPQGAGPALGFRPGAKRVQLSNGEAVLTPDQVQAAGGFKALEAMKNATHTPVPDQNTPGEPRFFFTNAGAVDDERQAALSQPANNSFGDAAAAAASPAVTQVPTGQPRPGASAADQIPSSAPPGWTGGQGERVTGNDFTRNVSNTLNALAPIAGAAAPIAAGIARAVTGGANAAIASPMLAKVAAYGVPAAGFGALASAADSDSPSTQQPPLAAGFKPAGSQPAPTTPAATGTPPAPETQPKALGFAPGVYQHGRSQFSDNPDGMGFSPGFTGRPNAQNSAAADALATRSMAGFQPNQQAATPAAPAASQNFTPPDTGQGHGYGLLNTNRIAMRNAMMDVQQGDRGARTALAGLLNQQAAAPGQQIEREKMAADVAAGAADRSLRSEELQSSRGFRAGQLANDAARTGVESQKAASEIEARGFEVNQAKRMQKLQDDYLNADTDEKRAAAAKKLQTLNGKQDQANRFTVVPGGQEFDATAGVMRNVPARVLNNQTGQFVDGAQQGAQPSQFPNAPAQGAVKGGYRFKGGDPAQPASWEKV